MKMTEQHREALRLARSQLARNGPSKAPYICWALADVGDAREDLRVPCADIRVEIFRYLAPWATLVLWQRCNGLPSLDAHADRIAWIDWMLAQDEL